MEELIKNWNAKHKAHAAEWADGGMRKHLDKLPVASGKLRKQMLNDMAASGGESRFHPETGEKEYKLYRASSVDSASYKKRRTSWTLEPRFARYWADVNSFVDKNNPEHKPPEQQVVHAWIPEKHIHSFLPTVLGPMQHEKTHELETIVEPHDVNIHHVETGKKLKHNIRKLEMSMISNKEFETLSKVEQEEVEKLAKKCPRCGGSSANSSNPSGRCRKHLNQLKTAKKTPGHWQRSQTKADDALRRQKGKNGTAPGTSSGNGNRKEIVDKIQRAEKKHGEKLSPDRKDNKKGYSSSNVRAVKESLNRGRHKVDPKKLKEWRAKLKKHNLENSELAALIVAKLEELKDNE